jgi:methionyl-tRNA formyltransferase
MSALRVTVVVDCPGWFDEFAQLLVERLRDRNHDSTFARSHEEIRSGDVAFYLSCTRITPPEVLALNRLNLVVHASKLPRGRGFSPLVWQVLEGKNSIPLTMIEAAEPVDSGPIHMTSEIQFSGHELNSEMRDVMGQEIVAMCLGYIDGAGYPTPVEQVGEPTFYRRRRSSDSRLDPDRTLGEQFDLLRVVDNERYPAFFDFRGRRFVLRIEDVGAAGEQS